MYKNKILQRLHELPVLCAWRLAILIAPKSYHSNIVVCDVTSTQSKYRDCFAADVKSALDDLALTSPEVLRRTQQYIRYIARAEITNRFDYFVRPRLLLLHVDYEHGDVDTLESIRRDIMEAVTLAHLRSERESVQQRTRTLKSDSDYPPA
jgi:hypothetical protein